MSSPYSSDTAPRDSRLYRGFLALAAVVYMLLVFGATVRVHGAGLACPDWPLCFGEVVPELDFQIFLEWGHRVLASAVSLGFLGLSAWALSRPDTRARLGRWIGFGFVVLAIQVVLGGLTVLHLLAFWSVTLHLLAGNLFLVIVLSLALRLREVPTGPVPPALRGLVIAGFAAWWLQMGLGGLVSSNYAGTACTEWPTCNGGVWFPTWDGPVALQVVHRLGAYLLATLLFATAWVARNDAAARGPTRLLALGVVAQMALGVANVWLALPVELAVAHSALGDFLGVGLVVTAWRVLPRPVAATSASPGLLTAAES